MHQTLQTEPLLRPKAAPIIYAIKLIADASWWITIIKVCRSENDIPYRKQYGKINAAGPALMANADAVVDTVKPWTHQQVFTYTPERKLQIRMGQALYHTGSDYDSHELRRCHTDQQRDQRKHAVHGDVVEQVVTIIRPKAHLLLRVMQAVQRPPRIPLMLRAMQPVGDEIEDQKIEKEG